MPLKQPVTRLSSINISGFRRPSDGSNAAAALKDYKIEKQLDELYEDAAIADRKLGRFINRVAREFKGTVGGIKTAPLKERSTAKAKLNRGGAGSRGVADLKDIARATLKFGCIETMLAARDYIKMQKEFTDLGNVAIKDRYMPVNRGGLGATAQGYRDIKFFLKVRVNTPRRWHIVELQLNTDTALKAKDVGHPFYDVVRLGGDDWDPEQGDSDIIIPADKVEKISKKLLHACHECIERDIAKADAKKVKAMVKKTFFKPVYARDKKGRQMFTDRKARQRLVDRYEVRTGRIRLRFNSPAQIEVGHALTRVSCAAYSYYKKLGHRYTWTHADNIHNWW